MVMTAATLFAINGVVAKVIIDSGLSAYRLCEVRTTWACAGFAVVLALVDRAAFRLERHELPFLLAFGFFGIFLVQIAYFLAIHRLDVGVALILQYTAP